MYKLENLKQGKKLVEQVVMEFKQLVGQAGLTTRSMSDNIHLIGLFREALNYAHAHKIMFGQVISRTIDNWYEKAIQFDTNWRGATAIFGSNSNKKNRNKTMNRTWYRPAGKKDPNTMDVDALTFKERHVLIEQGKCFKCRKTGQRATDCQIKKTGKKEEGRPKESRPSKECFCHNQSIDKG